MPETTYTYSIENDFLNKIVATDRLSLELYPIISPTILLRIETQGDDCKIYVGEELSQEVFSDFDAAVKAHTGESLPVDESEPPIAVSIQSINTDNNSINVVTFPTKSTRYAAYTHRWNDKTTWYQDSVRVVDETATADIFKLNYSLSHNYIIDIYHGKIFQEDYLKDSDNNSYRVVVKVNGTTKTERDPHYGTGGDYSINYEDGVITFFQSQGNNTVTATYYYAQSSKFIVAPKAGTKYDLVRVECQFTNDTKIKDTIIYKVTALVGPGGSRVTVSEPLVYKTMYNFCDDRDDTLEVQKAFDTSNWRGLSQDTYTIRWNYVSVTEFSSEYGTQIEIQLEHDEPFEGTFATTTLNFLVSNV